MRRNSLEAMLARLEEFLQRGLSGPPLRLNPFVLNRSFWLWLLLGVVGGTAAGLYWIVLEHILHAAGLVQGWKVIPLMAGAGLVSGLIIHWIGDPGEIQLIVNNIRFRGGRLESRYDCFVVFDYVAVVENLKGK